MFSFLKRGKKPLTRMDAKELRKNEIMAGGRQKRLTQQIEGLAAQKQSIFEHGAKSKSPELRRTLAQQFELLTTHEMIAGRTLNMATKETMIIGQLLAAKTHGGRESLIVKRDIAGLQLVMDKDAAAAAAYQAVLDDALSGMAVAEGETGLSEAGNAVLKCWGEMDAGTTELSDAMAEADRATRAKIAASQSE
jgi:hypothetical protein